jgi:hypothetical protein
MSGEKNGRDKRNIDKELPLNPEEQAGLREQRRQYTREQQQPNRKIEIDPNHAYPTRETSTTLVLSRLLSPRNGY